MFALSQDFQQSLVQAAFGSMIQNPIEQSMGTMLQQHVKTSQLTYEEKKSELIDTLYAKLDKAKEAGNGDVVASLDRRIKALEQL